MPVYPWQPVYKAAVLERDPAKLEEFVQSAFTVIYEHLRARGDITAEESEALSDALHALERLQKSKLDNKGSSLRPDPQESGSACPPSCGWFQC
jgi:hypothetical protein